MRLVRDAAATLGVAVTAAEAQRMAEHAEELLRWNRRVNLTAITEPREMAAKHFVDSLAAVPWLPPAARLLDVGTGAGFPGLPIRIVRPDIDLTLVDSVRKKVSFVAFLAGRLDLGGVRARHARLEELAAEVPPLRFDAVVCRAFGPLERWLAAAVALLEAGGRVLALKGPAVAGELAALGGGAGRVTVGDRRFAVVTRDYRLPVTGDRRVLVCLREDGV